MWFLLASVEEHYLLIDFAAAGDVRRIPALIVEHVRIWQPVFTAVLQERSSAATIRARER